MLSQRQQEKSDVSFRSQHFRSDDLLGKPSQVIGTHIVPIFRQLKQHLTNPGASFDRWRTPFFLAYNNFSPYREPLNSEDLDALRLAIGLALQDVEIWLVDSVVTRSGDTRTCWAWVEADTHKIIRIKVKDGLNQHFESLYNKLEAAVTLEERMVLKSQFEEVEATTIFTLYHGLVDSALRTWYPAYRDSSIRTPPGAGAAIPHPRQSHLHGESGEEAESKFVGMLVDLHTVDGKLRLIAQPNQGEWKMWNGVAPFIDSFWSTGFIFTPLIHRQSLDQSTLVLTPVPSLYEQLNHAPNTSYKPPPQTESPSENASFTNRQGSELSVASSTETFPTLISFVSSKPGTGSGGSEMDGQGEEMEVMDEREEGRESVELMVRTGEGEERVEVFGERVEGKGENTHRVLVAQAGPNTSMSDDVFYEQTLKPLGCSSRSLILTRH